MHFVRCLMPVLLSMAALLFSACGKTEMSSDIRISDSSITIQSADIAFFLDKAGFRYGFQRTSGEVLVPPHPISGLVAGSPERLVVASRTAFVGEREGIYSFEVTLEDSSTLFVRLKLSSEQAHFQIENSNGTPIAMALRTAGVSPGYGLGDNLIHWLRSRAEGPAYTTDITGFEDDDFRAGGHIRRMSSNFAIYPTQRFAVLNIDPRSKMVRSTSDEILQGSRATTKIENLYYFFGSPQVIYKNFLAVRNTSGYPVMKPKYPFYGVGWEAWGALAWRTREETVKADIDEYLDRGYPLSWMVVGSGFWPHSEKRLEATTSFGLWDTALYPDPEGFKDYFRKKGIKFFTGLRIAFITDGPFSQEGVENDYFLKENGAPKVFEIDFPNTPVYLLNVHKEEAVQWYVSLCDRWGVDGFKEDLYGYTDYVLPDDKINPVNEALMDKGYHIMLRNTYLASPGELHRINDFNYGENQDRGPINSLALAYSGFPMTYMDIIGGLFGGQDIDGDVSPRIKTYMMRNARIAALHSSMSMGKGPWHFSDEKVSAVVLASARLHDRLHPYFYSQAMRFHTDGFPWPMAPLALAFPDDPQVHYYENSDDRMYQWMIGDALLAYPLYGDDYDQATSRNVYLPQGRWVDYDTGQQYQGPLMLEDFEIPVEKTPLFVGGTGIVVEKVEGRLVARVYPVTDQGSTIYYGTDGETISTISIEGPDWQHVTVWDATEDKKIAHQKVRHAFEFELIPGHDYTIR